MTVFTRYAEVRTDTGETVDVLEAIQEAANAVAVWRVEQLAARGLAGVDAESRFVLLCWDVLGAAEFRFNEAMLLGRAVGMDVAQLKAAGLVAASGDKVKLLPASERRRAAPVRTLQEHQLTLIGEAASGRRRRRSTQRKVHPGDEYFVSAVDMVHALALRYAEAGGGQAGIGAARGMALQQAWTNTGPAALLMDALVNAAPEAVRFPGKKGSKTAADDFPEFRAWHALLKPLFAIEPPNGANPRRSPPPCLMPSRRPAKPWPAGTWTTQGMTSQRTSTRLIRTARQRTIPVTKTKKRTSRRCTTTLSPWRNIVYAMWRGRAS